MQLVGDITRVWVTQLLFCKKKCGDLSVADPATTGWEDQSVETWEVAVNTAQRTGWHLLVRSLSLSGNILNSLQGAHTTQFHVWISEVHIFKNWNLNKKGVYGNSSSGELEVVLFGSMYHRVGEGPPWAFLATAGGAAGGSSSSPTTLPWASADGMYPQKKCYHTFG